jgi:hypothetical protein
MTESIYPFLPSGASAPPQVFPYDVVINDAFPGIQFLPIEPNGEYQEIREVSGSLWLVTNAMWNANLLQWDQESPQNTGLPAYALALQADGSFARYMSPATNIPFTPITWTLLFVIDKDGLIVRSPNPLAAGTMIGEQTTLEFTAGSAVIVNADILFVTDVASNSESSVQLIEVNGTPIWKVRKDGLLEIGTVPYASVVGIPAPVFNNITFTGTSTFNGPVVVNSTLDVFGAGTFHSSLTADTTLFVAGHSGLNSLDVAAAAVFHGSFTANAGATANTLHVTGAATVDGSLTANSTLDVVGHTQLANVTLNAGDHIDVNGTTPVVTITSPDSSISVVQSTSHSYTVEVLTAPVAPGSSFVNTAFFPLGSTNGTISLGPLPGTAADTFRIIYWGALQFQNASKEITVTGVVAAGITWDVASQQYENANAGTFPFMYFGTAEGGTTPTINWTCNDVIAFTPMFTTIMASIQL